MEAFEKFKEVAQKKTELLVKIAALLVSTHENQKDLLRTTQQLQHN